MAERVGRQRTGCNIRLFMRARHDSLDATIAPPVPRGTVPHLIKIAVDTPSIRLLRHYLLVLNQELRRTVV